MADYGEGTGIVAIKEGRDRFSAQGNLNRETDRKNRLRRTGRPAPGPSPNPKEPDMSRFRSTITVAERRMNAMPDANMEMLKGALKKRKMEKQNGR